MTIIQAEKFYEQDLKKYEVLKNKELLFWFKDSVKKGYHPFIDIEGLQELVEILQRGMRLNIQSVKWSIMRK